jgi:signal transduction histidine kinase
VKPWYATIRAKTVGAAIAVVTVTLLVTGFLFVALIRRSIETNVDSSAKVRAEELALLMQKTKLPSVLPDSGEKGAVVQVVDARGANLAASDQVIERSRLSLLEPSTGDFKTENRNDLPITGDQTDDPFHVVAFGAQTPTGPITVYVGVGLDQVNENVASVRRILQVAFPILLGILAATSWYLVGRALRPVDIMREQVADMGEQDLSLRIPEPPVDDEIGRLARGMNLMLARLEESIERQRRFAADASHELQSPLASSLADLEVAIAHPTSTDWNALTASLVDDNQRMSKLVGDLLFLAKSDNGVNRTDFTEVDLDDVVCSEARRLQPYVDIRIDLAHVRPVQVWGSADQLARAARNLLENATRHAKTSVSVELTVHEEKTAVLAISDDGPGIGPAEHERVFERFVRLDDSRSRQSGGSGLGLAIVREIVKNHSGTVSIEPTPVGAKFVLRLPASVR